MGKILEVLLTDRLRIDNGTGRRTPEHQALCEKGSELQGRLAETLNDSQKEMLEELVETFFGESSYAEQMLFERGFRLGVLATSEIFYGQDAFFWEGTE